MKIFQLIDLIIRLFRLNKKAKAIALFLIPFAGSCQGGFYMAGEPYLLDEYPGASAAYSVHKLKRDYTVNAMQIRRASDNSTANIGFIDDNLDTPAISSHCAGTDCFVVTWYDQSGNGNHATQATTANQPKIYDSATGLVTDNGKPAIYIQGTGQLLEANITGLQNANNLSSFFAATPVNASAPDQNTIFLFRCALGGSDTNNPGFLYSASTGITSGETFMQYFSTNSNSYRIGSTSYSHSAGENIIFSIFNLNNGYTAYKNNSLINYNIFAGNPPANLNTSPAATNSNSNLIFIGVSGNVAEYFKTAIFYPSDQTANRVGIETSINNYFSIY